MLYDEVLHRAAIGIIDDRYLSPQTTRNDDETTTTTTTTTTTANIGNFARLYSVGYVYTVATCIQKTVPGVFTPGVTLRRTSVSPVGHSYPLPGTSVSSVRHSFIPVPGTSVRSVRPCHNNARGTGTAFFYLPGTSESSVRPCHNARNFRKFCKTFIPAPGTSVSSVGHSYPYPELL